MHATAQLVMAVALLAVGGRYLAEGRRLLRAGARAVPVPARILQVRYRRRHRYTVTLVEYPDATGARRRAVPRWSMSSPSYRVGQQVQVYADPLTPGLVLTGRRDGRTPVVAGALFTAVGAMLAVEWLVLLF